MHACSEILKLGARCAVAVAGGMLCLTKRLCSSAVLLVVHTQFGQVPVRAPQQVKKGARDDRVMVGPRDAAATSDWSHEESMLRTGVWSGVGVASGTEAGWESTQLGGSQVPS